MNTLFFFNAQNEKNQQIKSTAKVITRKNTHYKCVHVLIFPFYVSESFQNLGLLHELKLKPKCLLSSTVKHYYINLIIPNW